MDIKIGINAYLDNNFGDDIMLKLLFDYFPTYTFYVYTDKTVVKNTFCRIPNVYIRKGNVYLDTKIKHDLILNIGGSIFNDLNDLRGKLRRILKIIRIKKSKNKGVKIATIGCNLGPYNDSLGPVLTKYELKLNDLITVRDEQSFQLVENMKIKANYFKADDIVYNLNTKPANKNMRKFLGVTAYRSLEKNEKNFCNYVALANVIDQFIEKSKLNVKIFAFDTENENDLSAAHHIFQNCKHQDNIKIIPYLGNMDEFIKEFNSCKLMLPIRFHGSIMSDILKIPFLPIIYSNKTENLLIDNNYVEDKYYLDSFTTEKIDIEKIVNNLINNIDIFDEFSQVNNAIIHFEQLDILIKGIIK